MVLGSPTAEISRKLIFWTLNDSETIDLDGTSEKDDEVSRTLADELAPFPKGKSMYVLLFDDMIKTVLRLESSLFSLEEIDCFRRFVNLTEIGQYLLVRLCLRKTGRWHRLDSLKYERDLGDNVLDAIKELCRPCKTASCEFSPSEGRMQEHPDLHEEDKTPEKDRAGPKQPEIIDLTLEDDEEQAQVESLLQPVLGSASEPEPVAGPSRLKVEDIESSLHEAQPPAAEELATTVEDGPYSFFSEDESGATLRELLECLRLDELKAISKQMKLKVSKSAEALIDALLSSSTTQSTLAFPLVAAGSKGKGKSRDGLVQKTLEFVSSGQQRTGKKFKTQADRLREIVMKQLGKCVRVNEEVVKLFRRVNLVYFRSTQYSPALLTPAILSHANKRAYASYDHVRTPRIWSSREALLAYEEALELEAEVDALLENAGGPGLATRGRSVVGTAPGRSSLRLKTPVMPNDRLKTPGTPSVQSVNGAEEEEDGGEKITMRKQQARAVKAILEEVYPRWKDLVTTKEEEVARPISLQRFESGHILTRVVCKASSALGPLKEWAYELRVLGDLLGQRRWRRGRRGRWHERRVLLLTKREFIEQTPAACKRALAAVKEALEDADTHIIFRPKLERRLKTLEKKLNVPVEERHVCQGVLAEAVDTHIEGTRVWHRADAMVLDRTGRVVKPPSADIKPSIGVKAEAVSGLLQMSLPWDEQGEKMVEKTSRLASEKPRELPKWKGKSIWKGRDGEEVNVETLALQHFEDLGYRGYHCEGRIITTLFGFLMWDIIFAPIPGAFETPYQAAPLDLVDDTFLYSRQDLIEKRMAELEAGQAEQVLTHIYDENFERGTWCVGVRWDLFTREELLEIVKCLGGPALAVICRLLAEDYSGRVGGVPDLTIWNCEKGECKFVEVKGPGDVLRENQRAWIDVLLRAGVPVEMCRVEDAEGTKKAAKKGKTHADRERLKRKRVDYGLEDQRLPAESEDEEDEEVDYSQLDNSQPVQEATGDEDRPELITPKKRSTRGVVNRVEVVITSSPPKPIDSPVLKKRRL